MWYGPFKKAEKKITVSDWEDSLLIRIESFALKIRRKSRFIKLYTVLEMKIKKIVERYKYVKQVVIHIV